jgi:intracellular septation protein A
MSDPRWPIEKGRHGRSRKATGIGEKFVQAVANKRAMVRHLLPGMVLPGAIYFALSSHTSVIVALAAASSVPLLDILVRMCRRETLPPVSLIFVAAAGVSVLLAVLSGSPLFILVKGAVISAVLGIAFSISAAMNRPLTRTAAIRLSTDCPKQRATLRERWHHPKALEIFKALSFGWGALLLLSAMQQAAMAILLSPGFVVALEGPLHTSIMGVGVLVSVLYVRRFRHSHPELGLLPARS